MWFSRGKKKAQISKAKDNNTKDNNTKDDNTKDNSHNNHYDEEDIEETVTKLKKSMSNLEKSITDKYQAEINALKAENEHKSRFIEGLLLKMIDKTAAEATKPSATEVYLRNKAEREAKEASRNSGKGKLP